ncbi:MAG: YggU family protein [Proteobacteria bacterium]|nr:YggU family protein [Pseudomonadota bacterium]MBU1716424.1 YggU family protein [Pseudomonadota bacterium]
MTYLVQESADTITINVYVQPRSSRNCIVGLHGDALKIGTNAPPVDGKANEAIKKFLAKTFNLAKSNVVLKSGQQSRHKKFILQDISLEEARKIIEKIYPDLMQ